MTTRAKGKKSFLSFDTLIITTGLLAAIFLVSFRFVLWQPFNIPAGSMKPTLLVGDYLFVSKYAYGYCRFSFPFGLFNFEGRVFPKEPERGDIVVFRLPRDTSIDYIKRVIGLPGDEVQMRDGRLYINGKIVPRRPVEDFQDVSFRGEQIVKQYVETLPNGVSYGVLDIERNSSLDNTKPYRVPEGHYFLLGDNRDNSTDSRILSAVGYIPFDNLIGRAEVIFLSFDWDGEARNERVFKAIK